MRYKQVRNTLTEIPVIGQGCMGIGGYMSRDTTNDEEYIRALRFGIDCGMSMIDTAESYGCGYSEELAGRAAAGIRDKVFIATKVSPENLSYNNVIISAENSLKRLKTDYIDLYQIHWPNPGISLHETMAAMEKLVEQGKIRFIGICNFSLKGLTKVEENLKKNTIFSVQTEYNLFDRSIEENILPYCEQRGITVMAYSPLDQGRVADSYTRVESLKRIANKYNKTIAQVALQWIISRPVVVAIPKSVNGRHTKENADAADLELTQADIEEINRVFRQDVLQISVDKICVITGGQGNRQVYQTIEEAVENKLEFVPSPAELAEDIKNGDMLKPVRVVKRKTESDQYEYDLIEGRIRYWAWVIAHKGKLPVPAYVMHGLKY